MDVIDESTCPTNIEERISTKSEPVRIELDNSILETFNELSEDELEFVFGTFRPVQSLNRYMTKLSLCSIEKERLEFELIKD